VDDSGIGDAGLGDAGIRDLCAELEAASRSLFDDRWLLAASVALVEEAGTTYCNFGTLDGTPGGARPDPRTQWEIGSITKVVTGILLASMSLEGLVVLDQPVRELVTTATIPSAGGVEITLGHLATHTSGLPRMPTNFAPADPGDPFADYSVANLYAFLAGYTLPRQPGELYEYSNLGFALLGHALSSTAGQPWQQLANERVLAPLGMVDTAVALTPDQAARVAPPFNYDADPVRRWDLGIFDAAGGLYSTTEEMAKFVRAGAGIDVTPIEQAIALSQMERHPGVGLAWGIGPGVLGHSGQTGGYHSTVLLRRTAPRIGVVVLGNTSNIAPDIVANMAWAILQGEPPPIAGVPATTTPPADLTPYVGNYRIGPDPLEIRAAGERLDYYEPSGGPFRLWPSGGDSFHLRVVNATFTFERDGAGDVIAIQIFVNGQQLRADRVP
jgi:CubicO group peptidase (beta-lactamase class C family)